MIDYVVMLIPLFVINTLLGSVLGSTVYFFFFGVYQITQWVLYDGRTIGNRVVDTQVRDADSGGPIRFQKALWRYIYLEIWVLIYVFAVGVDSPTLKVVAVAYILIDLTYPLWDKRKQTVHDKLARTIVVSTK